MSVLAHLSDLHFGTEDPAVVDALLDDLQRVAPDLVAVSGDLTQRARVREFEAVRAFLDRLPAPSVVVPGNHDVPLYDVWRRMTSAFSRYRQHVSHDLCPFHVAGSMAVLGINTARRLTLKEGRVNAEQRALMARRFRGLPEAMWKVVVTHHPFIRQHETAGGSLVANATESIRAVENLGIDLVLSGHLHRAFHADAAVFHPTTRGAVLVVQAGTSTSKRRRGEPNAYNLLRLADGAVDVEVRAFDGRRFAGERRAVVPRRAVPMPGAREIAAIPLEVER